MPQQNLCWKLELTSDVLCTFGKAFYFLFLNSCTRHIFVILEHTVTRKTVCLCHVCLYEAVSATARRKKSVVTNIGGEMTASAASEQIDLERNGERENEREKGEAGGVWHYSITIRAVLDFPTFQNKETNFSQSPSGSHRKNHIIFSRQPPYNSEHCGILLLKLCIFKYQVKTPKRCCYYFFYCIFLHIKKKKKDVWCVYVL